MVLNDIIEQAAGRQSHASDLQGIVNVCVIMLWLPTNEL